MTTPLLVVYHKNCLDGLFAAAAIYDLQKQEVPGFEKLEFFPADYSTPIPDITDRDVLIVDFSWKPHDLVPAAKTAKSVLMIDHHISAFREWTTFGIDHPEDVPSNLKTIFDYNKSGAMLAWEFNAQKLQEASALDKVFIPELIKHVQDRDLWQFKLPNTRQIMAAVAEHECFQAGSVRKAWEFAASLTDVNLKTLAIEGIAIMACRKNQIRRLINRTSALFNVFGYEKIPVCQCPYELTSEMGEELYTRYQSAFAITYEDNLEMGYRKYDLRAPKDGPVDVSVLAKRMGGGGHHGAAGFIIPFDVEKNGFFKLFD